MNDFSSVELDQFKEKLIYACSEHDYGQAAALEQFIIDLELGFEPADSPIVAEVKEVFNDLDTQRLVRCIAAIYRENAAARTFGPTVIQTLGLRKDAIPTYLSKHYQ